MWSFAGLCIRAAIAAKARAVSYLLLVLKDLGQASCACSGARLRAHDRGAMSGIVSYVFFKLGNMGKGQLTCYTLKGMLSMVLDPDNVGRGSCRAANLQQFEEVALTAARSHELCCLWYMFVVRHGPQDRRDAWVQC